MAARLTPPVTMGLTSALTGLGAALTFGLVPAVLIMLSAENNPVGVLGAILLGISFAVLGHGGSLSVPSGAVEGAISLAPLGFTILLLLIGTLSMRRTGRRLDLLTGAGGLRSSAIQDMGLAMASYIATYAAGLGIIATLGSGMLAEPVVVSAVFSGAVVAACSGVLGLALSLRRAAFGSRPAIRALDLVPAQIQPLVRSVVISALGLGALGLLTASVASLLRLGEIRQIIDILDPGTFGFFALFLMHLAYLPTVGLWALAVLLGGTVSVGVGTELSLGGFTSGALPIFPTLGALPEPGNAPAVTWALLALPLAVLCLGAAALVKATIDMPSRRRWALWIAQPLAVTALMLVVLRCGAGAVGAGNLSYMGPELGRTALPLLGLSVMAMALMVTVYATPLIAWIHEQIRTLREKVEKEEALERGDSSPDSDGAREEPDGAHHESDEARNKEATLGAASSEDRDLSPRTDQ